MNEIDALRKRVEDLEQDRKSFFKTGILVLGAATLGLLGYVWTIHIGG